MKHLGIGLFSLLCTLILAPGASAFPQVETCKGALEPSKVDGCDGVGWEGCCDVTGRQFWCEGGDLYCVDCANGFPACGWNPLGYYDCGQAPKSEDPSGEHPYACGACAPECAEGAGCSEACPGGCGICEGDGVCMDDGSCYVPQCGDKQCGQDPLGFSCGTCGDGESCVEEVGKCLPLPSACVPQQGPGCDGCSCEACVCELYPGCCTENWDLFCATACELECGYNCDACPAEPSCDGIECGEFCGVDCGSCAQGSVCLSGACCAPACGGKDCGSDGCGGSCGACQGTDTCSEAGVCEACQPSCDGKACGPDGCGGSCGACGESSYCSEAGQCEESACAGKCDKSKVSCGEDCECYCDTECFGYGDCCDGICLVCEEKYADECCAPQCTDKQCGDDGCGGSCGDCDQGECADGLCVDCEPDCEGKQCGDDRCGGSCGTCDENANCEAGQCVVCEPSCVGKNCGDDGCGGSCGTCEDGLTCGDQQICISDGSCGAITSQGCCWNEDAYFCGDDDTLLSTSCDEPCGWNGEQNRYTCGGQGADPTGALPNDCWEIPCVPNCGGKNCGADGCGGTCGECGEEEFCNINQTCQEKTQCGEIPAIGCCLDNVLFYCQSDSQVIQLNCGLEPCGWDTNALDGAGAYTCGVAGAEPSGKESHSCDGSCYPVCHGKTCGGDGCGGSCGTCPEGIECIDNQCFDENICVPSCIEKQCGDDGCGGSCGDCPPEAGCLTNGLCAYIDDCDTIGYEGVCAGDRIYWCENGDIFTYDCAELEKTCGTTEGVGQSCVEPPPCQKSCDGRTCGDDGCGGSCGSCDSGQTCFEGNCALGGGDSTTLSGSQSDSGCSGGSRPWFGGAWLLLAGLALALSRYRRAG